MFVSTVLSPLSGRGTRLILILLAVLLSVTALSACATRSTVPPPAESFGAPDVETVAPSSSEQRVGPLDKVKISVFQVEDLSGEFQVDAAGMLQFPLIGNVEAQGLLPGELARLIARRLGERYLRSPNVQVAISEQREQTITVDGSVREPGVLPIRGTTTLMRAVALAKGTTPDADPGRVVVFRTVGGERMAAGFDLRAIRQAEAKDPLIYGNDIIVVDGARARSIFREAIGVIPLLGLFLPIIR